MTLASLRAQEPSTGVPQSFLNALPQMNLKAFRFAKEKKKYPPLLRRSVAMMGTSCSSNSVGDVTKFAFQALGYDLHDAVSPNFVQQCEREYSLAADYFFVMVLGKSKFRGVGTDGTSKMDLNRSCLEVEIFGFLDQQLWSYPFHMEELVSHEDAPIVVNVIKEVVNAIQVIQREMGWDVLWLHEIVEVFCSDNASVNSGKNAGVAALLEAERKISFRDHKREGETYKELAVVGCTDHVVNIASKNFHKSLAEYATSQNLTSLLPPNGWYTNNVHWLATAIAAKLTKGFVKDFYEVFCMKMQTKRIPWTKVSLCRYQTVDLTCCYIMEVYPALLLFFEKMGQFDSNCKKIAHFLGLPEMVAAMSVSAVASNKIFRPIMEIASKVTSVHLFNVCVDETAKFLEHTSPSASFCTPLCNISHQVKECLGENRLPTMLAITYSNEKSELEGGEEIYEIATQLLTKDYSELDEVMKGTMVKLMESRKTEEEKEPESPEWQVLVNSGSVDQQVLIKEIGGLLFKHTTFALKKHLLHKQDTNARVVDALRATNRGGERNLAFWDQSLRVNKHTRISTILSKIKVRAAPPSVNLFDLFPGVDFSSQANALYRNDFSRKELALRKTTEKSKIAIAEAGKEKRKQDQRSAEQKVLDYVNFKSVKSHTTLTVEILKAYLRVRKICNKKIRTGGSKSELMATLEEDALAHDAAGWATVGGPTIEEVD